MYLICNLGDIWSLYNGAKMTNKALTPQQVELIKEIFADDIKETALYNTLHVAPIAPNKVEQLMAKSPKSPPALKKAA